MIQRAGVIVEGQSTLVQPMRLSIVSLIFCFIAQSHVKQYRQAIMQSRAYVAHVFSQSSTKPGEMIIIILSRIVQQRSSNIFINPKDANANATNQQMLLQNPNSIPYFLPGNSLIHFTMMSMAWFCSFSTSALTSALSFQKSDMWSPPGMTRTGVLSPVVCIGPPGRMGDDTLPYSQGSNWLLTYSTRCCPAYV